MRVICFWPSDIGWNYRNNKRGDSVCVCVCVVCVTFRIIIIIIIIM